MSKQEISIAQEALGFLNNIVSLYAQSINSVKESRKLNTFFNAVSPAIKVYDQEVQALQKEVRVPDNFKDAQGNTKEMYRVPLDRQDEYNQRLADMGNKRVTVGLEHESYSLAQRVFKGMNNIPGIKESGGIAAMFKIPGNLIVKYINEIATALDIDEVDGIKQKEKSGDSEGNA